MSPDAIWALGDFLALLLTPFDWYFLWDFLNMGVIVLGFVGLFIWLRLQGKYTKQAKEEGGIM
ncbi:MAG: hypothetical protein R2799_00830 [Crocinitomicaceae bacterium]|nr:hypothetical protein [Crocinitomicaceae bacterium]